MSLKSVQLGQLLLRTPVMNAAGPWASSEKDLKVLVKSKASAVVTKSFSLEPIAGNNKPNVYFEPNFSINSVGLENRGFEFFTKAVSSFNEKPIIASIVAFNINEFTNLIEKLNHSNFACLELNLSCPNISTKAPFGYSPETVEKLLKKLSKIATKPISVKLPPYFSRSTIAEISEILLENRVNHIVLVNTLPLATALNNKSRPVIEPNDGVGGLGGRYLKPVALAHVKLFSKFLKSRVPIVGVGGIEARKDVEDFLSLGASAVQVGSAIARTGPTIFEDLV